MLSIKNLHATVHGKEILRGVDLEIGAGEVHAIMGPNGSGKSTLSYVLSGREGYDVTDGEIIYNDKNLLELDVHERAGEGIFLAFQYPGRDSRRFQHELSADIVEFYSALSR